MIIDEMMYQYYLRNRYKFTALPSASAFGYGSALVTDVGTGPGSRWESNGTNWKPVGGHITLATLATRLSVSGGGVETVAHQFQMPAAFLNVGDRIRIWTGMSKAGTTTAGTFSVRIGTAGTTSDTLISGTGGVILSNANRSIGMINDFIVVSATSIIRPGSSINQVPGYSPAVATAYNAATTISNISNSLWVSVTITPGATDAVAIEDNQIQYISS